MQVKTKTEEGNAAGSILVMTKLVLVMGYRCHLWLSTTPHSPDDRIPVEPVSERGLSSSDLEKLPKITGKELLMDTECAICLDEIENEQLARLVHGCNHAFHVECVDT
ncbi:hypothetical protein PIB30_003832 [Stylosanthes scabra]|uniref:RING-type domain-containing protein n=1 Tax=Stylosanthes scabra TaxID=79078 RepID=A0ABU6T322_9FABA|nr:hypothetical protein [Stylosanthes scabra]